MARYWRMTSILTWNGTLELSEAQLYEDGTPVAVTPTANISPTSGNMSDLVDGLATSSVVWSGAMPTLVWDTAGLTAPFLWLGSGTSEDAFPVDLILQSSDDALYWTTYASIKSLAYPGDWTLSAVPAGAPVDPHAASVLLHINGDIADIGPANLTLGTIGSPQVASVDGIPCIVFDGNSQITVPASSGVGVISGDITIEAVVRYANSTQQYHQLIDARTNGGTAAAWVFTAFNDGGGMRQSMYLAGNNLASSVTPAGTWRTIVFRRSGSTCEFFDNGLSAGTVTVAGAITGTSTTDIHIGGKDAPQYSFNGHLAALRITNVARAPSDFLTQPQDYVKGPRKYKASSLASPVYTNPAPGFPTEITVTQHRPAFTIMDASHGGQFHITGTVKEESTPSNLPLRRRVVLIDERAQAMVRETWSDDNGNYMFYGIRGDIRFSIISYDYTNTYRAAIIDNIFALPI